MMSAQEGKTCASVPLRSMIKIVKHKGPCVYVLKMYPHRWRCGQQCAHALHELWTIPAGADPRFNGQGQLTVIIYDQHTTLSIDFRSGQMQLKYIVVYSFALHPNLSCRSIYTRRRGNGLATVGFGGEDWRTYTLGNPMLGGGPPPPRFREEKNKCFRRQQKQKR
jgi:hypothetical protein